MSTKKKVIKCPFCASILIKQYFSTHMKKIHANSAYSTIIKKGMKFNFSNGLKAEIKKDEFFCDICNAIVKNNSNYLHFKTKLHKELRKMNNIEKKNSLKKIFFVVNKEELNNVLDNNNLEKKFNTLKANCRPDAIDSLKLSINHNDIDYITLYDGDNNLTNKFNLNTEEKINNDSSDESYSLSSLKKSEFNYSYVSSNSQIYYKKIDTGLIPLNFRHNHDSRDICNIKNESYFSKKFRPNTSKNNPSSLNEDDSLSSSSDYQYSYDNSFVSIEEMKLREEIDKKIEKLLLKNKRKLK